MNKQVNLDELLANASESRHFRDGSAERVWGRAAAARKKARPAFLRAIPAIAVYLALICMFAVPQSRSAVFFCLGTVSGYLHAAGPGQPSGSGAPVLTNGGVPATMTVSGIQPGGEWVNSLQARVEKVEYDGQLVTISFSVMGKNVDHLMINPPTEPGKTEEGKTFGASNLIVNGLVLRMTSNPFQATPNNDGQYKLEAIFNAEVCEGFSGIVPATLELACENMIYNSDGTYTGNPAGTIQLHFSLDVSAGNSAIKRVDPVNEIHPLSGKIIVTDDLNDAVNNKEIYTNKEITLVGCSIKVVSILRKAAETEIKLELNPSAQFTESMLNAFTTGIDATVLSNGIDVSKGLSDSDDDNIISLVLTARNIPGEADKLTINLYSFHSTAINGVPLELNKPYSIDLNTNDSSSANAASLSSDILFGTFDIELPK